MVLGRITATTLEFYRRGRLRAPLLTATAFAVLALLPLLTPGVPDGHPIATAVLLGALSVSLFWYSVRRAERLIVDLAQGVVRTRRGDLPLSGARELVLTNTTEVDEAPRRRYRIELLFASGAHLRLLEGSDPARVLSDLRKVLGVLELPVRTGWGLPPGATPWRDGEAPAAAATAPAFVAEARPYESQGRTAATVFGGTVVIAVAMGIMMTARLRRGEAISALSASLAAVTLLILLVVGVVVLGLRTRVRWGDGTLDIERTVFGHAFGRERVVVEKLRGVHAVSPGTEMLEHVLLDAGDDLYAVACAGGGGSELAAALQTLAPQSATRTVPGTQSRS
ncbi:MAG: hypothetical protein KC776_05000 [Myxococcales bacterium]|nr:hypothetical protein [Myxococcales bacterium]MCB9580891.1 hypothetical protein [Polyangiaceae bacterium]